MTPFGLVSQIWRYPVSSLGGERLDEAELVPGGIPDDRVWGVVDRRDDTVAAPEKRRHWRPLPNLLARLGDGGPEITRDKDAWLAAGSTAADDLVSTFLEFPAAVRPHGPFGSDTSGRIAPRYQRADLHILTTASMRALAELLPDPSQVDPRRFRPNLVVETDPAWTGFAEHRIVGKTLAIGDVRILVSEPCERCSFTALAQGDLAFEPAVLQTIARHGEGGFGVLCQIVQPGHIRQGDGVTLAEG
ncbi:MAG: MOSC domain-containing protein [Mesorhizobium sp.]|uniref:MOSC domain-containing protein n=1 Tax=Mesorhizobium sp. TaxID=1871066 RepID=UPI001ACA4614|nr:MOSC domain-containing protein [Mesorhizobium sp.]MBN9217960.1 MOSC domain-containing protein [Mesorhizobium sp.]